ncbi:importin-4-like [Pyrus ussuriensis x Pyrus communis]|uniref:Importin-4-like n=1 Tax=Pyrus ussuriensis x Pyrus communis TaxID=2448454 RepID=A0A5N5G9F0_9ROSA|nr:importin-4-like [Pyrus ussuriensis x Pyrus communis]
MTNNGSVPQSPPEKSPGSQGNQDPNNLQATISRMLKAIEIMAFENRRSISKSVRLTASFNRNWSWHCRYDRPYQPQ